ncbi:hypothetical protein Dimus_038435 [Dionaea muscipula]
MKIKQKLTWNQNPQKKERDQEQLKPMCCQRQGGTREGTDPLQQPEPEQQIEEVRSPATHHPLQARSWKYQSFHPLDQIISDIEKGVQTRSDLNNFYLFSRFLSYIEPKNIFDALQDTDWVMAMQEELHQFEEIMCGTWGLNHLTEPS